jgi:hypothetical protein
MKIDRRFPPTWSAAHDRLYWREWAAVQRADPRADRSALTIKALGADKWEAEFTDVEFAKVLEAFREISRPPDLLTIVEAADTRKRHLRLVIGRVAAKAGADVGNIDHLTEGELDALRLRLSHQLVEARAA